MEFQQFSINPADAQLLESKSFQIKAYIVNTDTVNEYDLIGFGSGIYLGKFHKKILSFIHDLPRMKNKKAFVFSTSGKGTLCYNKFLEKKLKTKGFCMQRV